MLRGDKTQTLATRTNWQSPPRHKCWQPSPWWPRRAIALSLPREVNLPGWPEGGQLRSRSALNKQSAPAEEQETEKTAAALTITLHPSIIPLTPTQSCEMQPSHSSLSLSLSLPPLSLSVFPFIFPPPFHLVWSCRGLACSGQRVPLQNELMFTINKSAEGETAEELQPGPCQAQRCVTPPNTEPLSDHYSEALECLFCDLSLRLIIVQQKFYTFLIICLNLLEYLRVIFSFFDGFKMLLLLVFLFCGIFYYKGRQTD